MYLVVASREGADVQDVADGVTTRRPRISPGTGPPTQWILRNSRPPSSDLAPEANGATPHRDHAPPPLRRPSGQRRRSSASASAPRRRRRRRPHRPRPPPQMPKLCQRGEAARSPPPPSLAAARRLPGGGLWWRQGGGGGGGAGRLGFWSPHESPQSGETRGLVPPPRKNLATFSRLSKPWFLLIEEASYKKLNCTNRISL